jgi:hypothetical protein
MHDSHSTNDARDATEASAHPDLEPPLRDGRVCLSAVAHLARVMTADNHAEVLPRFFHLSSREAEALAASIVPRPAPAVRQVITAVRQPESTPVPEAGMTEVHAPELKPDRSQAEHMPGAPAFERADAAPRPVVARPMTADLNRLHVTVSRRFLEKLGRDGRALPFAPGRRRLRVCCATHDAVAARRVLGEERMDRYTERGRAPAC